MSTNSSPAHPLSWDPVRVPNTQKTREEVDVEAQLRPASSQHVLADIPKDASIVCCYGRSTPAKVQRPCSRSTMINNPSAAAQRPLLHLRVHPDCRCCCCKTLTDAHAVSNTAGCAQQLFLCTFTCFCTHSRIIHHTLKT